MNDQDVGCAGLLRWVRWLGWGIGLCIFNVNAAVENAFVSTLQDTPIIIDLSANVSTEPEFASLTVTRAADNGSAEVSGAAEVIYTPNTGYNGTDSFEYTALDISGNPLGTATVTVSVGTLSLTTSGDNNAGTEFTNLLNTACIANDGSPVSPELVDICADFFNATDAERIKLANELAPREANGKDNVSSSVTAQQIDGARKRLIALRQGTAAINPVNISFNLRRRFTSNDLFGGSGGGASADSNSRTGVYVSANIGGGDYSPGPNTSDEGYEFSIKGLTAGADYRLSHEAVLGGALGYTNSDMDLVNNGGQLDAKGFNFIGYGSYYFDSKTYFESIVGFYKNDFNATRHIDYQVNNVAKTATASSETQNRTFSASIGMGHELSFKSGLTTVFSLNLDYIRSAVDGYVESGAGSANLSVDGRQESNQISTVNMTATYPISLRKAVLIPQFDLAWKHDFSAGTKTVSGALAADANNTRFSFATNESSSDYLKTGIGVSYVMVGGNTGFMYLENYFGRKDFSEYNFSIGVRFEL